MDNQQVAADLFSALDEETWMPFDDCTGVQGTPESEQRV